MKQRDLFPIKNVTAYIHTTNPDYSGEENWGDRIKLKNKKPIRNSAFYKY